jgi:hypothetical protein
MFRMLADELELLPSAADVDELAEDPEDFALPWLPW